MYYLSYNTNQYNAYSVRNNLMYKHAAQFLGNIQCNPIIGILNILHVMSYGYLKYSKGIKSGNDSPLCITHLLY